MNAGLVNRSIGAINGRGPGPVRYLPPLIALPVGLEWRDVFPPDERTRPLARKPVLLSGGNPQIAKGDGEGPVKAYIAAMPGWKCAAGRQVDAIVERTVDNLKKGVRWNSPFYGIEGQGWFLSFHVYTRYVKLTFFSGAKLDPPPPVESSDKSSRHFHIFEDDELDEKQLAKWVEQAARLPGRDPSKG